MNKTNREKNILSFKQYVMTGAIIFGIIFLQLQFVIKKYYLTGKLGSVVEGYFWCFICIIGLITWFVRIIIDIRKKYQFHNDYNKKVAYAYIFYSSILLITSLFIW